MAGARIDQIKNYSGFPAGVKNVPANYPDHPTPGKISLLFNANSTNIYHRFSPYTDGDNIFGIFPNKQPFIYRYPDEAHNSSFNKLPAFTKTLALAINIPSVVDDTVRIGRFLISPQGVIYNVKQIGLQLLNSFDETRLYNPLSPILATVYPATLGLVDRPIRHISITNPFSNLGITSTAGVGTLLGSLTGNIFAPPSTTAFLNSEALPNESQKDGAGLIRGPDSALAESNLRLKWQGSSIAGKLNNLVQSSITTLLSRFLPPLLSGVFSNLGGQKYRADENTYNLMVTAGSGKFLNFTKDGASVPVNQIWIAKQVEYENNIDPDDSPLEFKLDDFPTSTSEETFNDLQSEQVKAVTKGLQQVINNINNSGIYKMSNIPTSYIFPGFDGSFNPIAYNNWIEKQKRTGAQKIGAGGEYMDGNGSGLADSVPKVIDASSAKFSKNSLRMATSFKSDGINQLGILLNNRTINDANSSVSSLYKGSWDKWNPYEDDLIAFFFYDVVNEKYVPFRATVKGISEGNTAFWDELRFIGRADQLYSYNGFSRTLSFTFNVVINSVSELLPTWKKINYMATSVKPSNYTSGKNSGDVFNRFIVPPMFMVTIGDLYKMQPMVITSLNVNIPDDAVWETLNELNATSGWNYLNGIITSPSLGNKYGQMPKEVEIAITCNLLEKERAIVGGSHFGHAPRQDNWVVGYEYNIDRSVEFLPSPSGFSANMLEINKSNTSATQPAISSIANQPTAATNTTNTFTSVNRGGQTFAATTLPPTSIPTTTGIATSGGKVTNPPILPPPA